jgi:hypothetical protein
MDVVDDRSPCEGGQNTPRKKFRVMEMQHTRAASYASPPDAGRCDENPTRPRSRPRYSPDHHAVDLHILVTRHIKLHGVAGTGERRGLLPDYANVVSGVDRTQMGNFDGEWHTVLPETKKVTCLWSHNRELA